MFKFDIVMVPLFPPQVVGLVLETFAAVGVGGVGLIEMPKVAGLDVHPAMVCVTLTL